MGATSSGLEGARSDKSWTPSRATPDLTGLNPAAVGDGALSGREDALGGFRHEGEAYWPSPSTSGAKLAAEPRRIAAVRSTSSGWAARWPAVRTTSSTWRHDGCVSTRTLIVLAAVCAVAILAASAIQIVLAR